MKPKILDQKFKKTIIRRLSCVAIPFFILITSFQVSAEQVKFKGTGTTYGGDPLTLVAKLEKPAGNGPFPAVIMMHGCDGDNSFLDPWEWRLINWGYVVLRVDSLGSRSRPTFCDDEDVKTAKWRSQDAYDAKTYLRQLKFVDKDNIALIGWSHGGDAAVYAIDDGISYENKGNSFKAAIAFYPYCTGPLSKQNAPLLVLIGEKDDICKAEYCESAFASGKPPKEIKLIVYKDAYHCFDWNIYYIWQGHKLEYNPDAAKDAEAQVKKFLAKYLK